MKLKHHTVKFQFKALKDNGEYEGYASTFGNADQIRDVVMPGAFADSLVKWAAEDAMPPCLWQHDSYAPIGATTSIAEDGKGLAVAGQLLIKDVVQAREAFALAKAKVVRGLSFGYDTIEEEYDGKLNINKLIKVDLYEYSFVTFPMNTQATITSVKQMLAGGELPSLSEFEDFLREAGNFSRSQAKAIAGHGLRKLLEQRDADKSKLDDSEVESVLAMVREHPFQL